MSGKRILCVDDDTGILRALRRILERKGYSVAACVNGKDALAEISAEEFDLIILDLMMPGMDGHELLGVIRRTRQCSAPVVMLTAKDDGDEVLKGYREGATYYITKPFKNRYVINIVEYLLGDLSKSEKQALELKL
jgi:DNA-binding response OmpR family regulator